MFQLPQNKLHFISTDIFIAIFIAILLICKNEDRMSYKQDNLEKLNVVHLSSEFPPHIHFALLSSHFNISEFLSLLLLAINVIFLP